MKRTRRVVTTRQLFQKVPRTFFEIATSCYFTSANTTTRLPLDGSSSPKSRPDSARVYWTSLEFHSPSLSILIITQSKASFLVILNYSKSGFDKLLNFCLEPISINSVLALFKVESFYNVLSHFPCLFVGTGF